MEILREQTHDRILAYAVELTGAANGTVQGNLYELDYQQHFQHIRDVALACGCQSPTDRSGDVGKCQRDLNNRRTKYFGEFVRYEMSPGTRNSNKRPIRLGAAQLATGWAR